MDKVYEIQTEENKQPEAEPIHKENQSKPKQKKTTQPAPRKPISTLAPLLREFHPNNVQQPETEEARMRRILGSAAMEEATDRLMALRIVI